MNLIIFGLLAFSVQSLATPIHINASPYDVVVPILSGDPANSVSGQLYYDSGAGRFKGIDNGSNVQSFLLLSDVGTTANKIVRLDGTGKLPAVDGSQLTNLPVSGANTALSNLGSTAINDSLLPAAVCGPGSFVTKSGIV